MKFAMNSVIEVLENLLTSGAVKATKYLSEKEVIRATRRTVQGKIPKKGNIEISLTLGRPNYEERKFVKTCKKAKQKFPIQKVQLKFLKKR